MTTISKNAKLIKSYLQAHTIANIKEFMNLLNKSKPTVNRALSEIEYSTSISHSGKYYSAKKSPKVNEYGIWMHKEVSFSSHGTLAETVRYIVTLSNKGYTSTDLKKILNIAPNEALISLTNSTLLLREKFNGVYTYFSSDKKTHQLQLKRRQLMAAEQSQVPSTSKNTSDEIKAYIIMFYCLLDEKQKRIYAGLEALKHGKGGDNFVSNLLGLDIKTVIKGRFELEEEDFVSNSIRRSGGGRVSVKKKRQK